MRSAAKHNLHATESTPQTLALHFIDAVGADLDLTGYTLTGAVEQDGILAPECAFTDASNAEVEIKDATKSGAQLPHLDMLKQADEACDILILGQTLTSSVSDSGGNRALGEVHENTEDKVTLARGKYVAGILTRQLVPAILRLNLGTVPEHTPTIVLRGTSDKMSMKKLEWVERAVKIAEVSKEQVYDWLDIPQPDPGAELYQPPAWAQEEADPFGAESLIHAARKKKA